MTAPTFDAAQDALDAAVPGARGWFRYGQGQSGAINVRTAGAVQTAQYGDGEYRIMAQGAQTFELRVGPYAEPEQAAEVADAILRLAYNDVQWPST